MRDMVVRESDVGPVQETRKSQLGCPSGTHCNGKCINADISMFLVYNDSIKTPTSIPVF